MNKRRNPSTKVSGYFTRNSYKQKGRVKGLLHHSVYRCRNPKMTTKTRLYSDRYLCNTSGPWIFIHMTTFLWLQQDRKRDKVNIPEANKCAGKIPEASSTSLIFSSIKRENPTATPGHNRPYNCCYYKRSQNCSHAPYYGACRKQRHCLIILQAQAT